MLAWLGGTLLFLDARPTDATFRWGIPFVIAGEFIRLWACGHLERKGKKLATQGPFAYVRNPLYLGNFLIGLGVVTISGRILNGVLFLGGFWFLYRGTIRKEEEGLREQFGGSYLRYLREVPRFLPRLTPTSFREKGLFQWRLLLKHREHVAVSGLLLCSAALYLQEKTLIQKSLGRREVIAWAVVALAIATLIGERIWDWKKNKAKNYKLNCKS